MNREEWEIDWDNAEIASVQAELNEEQKAELKAERVELLTSMYNYWASIINECDTEIKQLKEQSKQANKHIAKIERIINHIKEDNND